MNKEGITISELSRLTGIPSSTIRFYLRVRLIASPLRKGKTRAYFNKDHIIQLKKIQELRSKNKLSIDEIKNMHSFMPIVEGDAALNQSSASDRKNDIITHAIDLFLSYRYESINISDIAEQASISKVTFYKYFSSKEELFYECADRVSSDIDKEFKKLFNGKNVIDKIRLRTSFFIKTHRDMIDMLQVMRGTSGTNASLNKLKLKQIITNLAIPIANDLDEGIKQGLFRNTNTTVVAHMIMGATEYGIYFLEGKSDSEVDQFINTGITLILRSLTPDSHARR